MINKKQKSLNNAKCNLEILLEDDLLDSYAYCIKSFETKYEYLLKK